MYFDVALNRGESLEDTQDRLERLRGILYEPPSQEGWRALVGLFEAWPADEASLLVGVDYAQERLELWPQELRAAGLGLGFELVAYERSASGRPRWRFAGLRDVPHPAWSLGRKLDLSGLVGGLRPAEAKALSQWPHMAELSWLRAAQVFVGGLGESADTSVVHLAGAPWFSELSRVELPQNGIGPRGASFLVGSARPHLRWLDLDQNAVENMGATFIGASPHLRGLERLQLEGNGIGDPGLRALARSEHLAAVSHFGFGGNLAGDRGFEALLSSPLMRGLETLEFSRNRLSAAGVMGLAQSPGASSLFALDLSDNAVGPQGASALAQSPSLAGLRRLSLAGCGVEGAGAEALAQSASLRHLRHLDLSGNHIGPRGAAALAASANVCSLDTLDLSENLIGEEGRRALAHSPHLKAHVRLSFAMA